MEKITEAKAAARFVTAKFLQARELWPNVEVGLKDMGVDVLIQADERAAKQFGLALACLAFDLRALDNLFEGNQAFRLRTRTMEVIAANDHDNFALEGLSEISAQLDDAFALDLGPDTVPLLGEALYRFLGFKTSEQPSACSPSVAMFLGGALGRSCGFWKSIRDQYEVVECEGASVDPKLWERLKRLVELWEKNRLDAISLQVGASTEKQTALAMYADAYGRCAEQLRSLLNEVNC